jgi:protein tyrosine phosphatase (PTP) superfamily phosphohydrolase (DUF442 family)
MADLSQIKNFLQVDDYCATAGQPTVEQFADIGAAGYETVIYLGTPDSETALPNEGELVTKQGMRYVHIPVVWTAPKKSDFELFVAIMNAHPNRKVLTHCVVNMRASAFMFLYRILYQGVDPSEAKRLMQEIWDPNAVWEQFIDEVLQEQGVDYFDID